MTRRSAPILAVLLVVVPALVVGFAGRSATAMQPPAPHVTALAVSPQGRLLVAASSRGWLALWNLDEGRLVRAFKAHDDDIYLLRFSRGGDRLLTGSDDNTAKLWSLPGLSNVRTMETSGVVTGGDMADDGTSVVLGLWDGTLQAWDVVTGRRKASVKGHLFGRVTVDIAPSGKRIVTGGSDQTVRLWDAATLRQIGYLKSGERGIKAHLGVIYGVRFLDDDRVLSSASRGSAALAHLALWDARTGALLRSSMGVGSSVGIAPAEDNTRVVFVDRDEGQRRAVIFDPARWRETRILDPKDGVVAATISPDGRVAVTGSQAGRISFWDAESGRFLVAVWSRFDRGWGVETADGRHAAGGEAARELAGALVSNVTGGRR